MQQNREEVLGRYGLQPDQLELGDVLSSDGAYGIVRTGILIGSGGSSKEVAVKLLPLAGATAREVDMILSEAVALARASESCKYACKLLGMCRKDEHFCIVMKKYPGGSLSRKLDTYADRRAPLRDVERWLVEICQGVAEMHEEGIVLHDLKPSNVLLDGFGGVVLADFGLARIVKSTIRTQTTATGSVRGTVPYMSPEAINPDDGRPGMPSDIWSLGCTMYELLTGKVPWHGSNGTVQIITRVVVQRRIPDFTGLEDRIGSFAEVLETCFRFEPTSRPTAHDVWMAVRAKCELQSAIRDGPQHPGTPEMAGAGVAASASNLAAQFQAGLSFEDASSYPTGRSSQTTSEGDQQETGRLALGPGRSQASGAEADRNNQASLPPTARAGCNPDDLRRRAEGGDPAAQFGLASLTEAQGDLVRAFDWYNRAAEGGLPGAQFELGHCYLMGNGVEESTERAVEWFEKAANAGNVGAQFCLARCIELGLGTSTPPQVSSQWYCKAAEQWGLTGVVQWLNENGAAPLDVILQNANQSGELLEKVFGLPHVDLRSCNLSAEALTAALDRGCFPILKTLNLKDVGPITEDGVKALAAALASGNLPALQFLDVTSDEIIHEGGPILAAALGQGALKNLHTLNMSVFYMGDRGAEALAAAMKNWALRKLRIDGNCVGDKGATALAAALVNGSFPALQELNCCFNRIGADGAKALAAALELGSYPALQKLRLHRNDYGDEGSKALAEALGRSVFSRLQNLDLSLTGMGVDGAKSLAAGLRRGSFPSLKKLDVDIMLYIVREDRAKVLRELLPALEYGCSSTIQEFSNQCLFENEIGAKELAAAFNRGSFPSLRRLAISFRGGGGAKKALVDAVFGQARLASLEELVLEHLNDEDTKAVTASLSTASFPALTTLGIYRIFTDAQGIKAFTAALGRGFAALRTLNIVCSDSIGDEGAVNLAATLGHNSFSTLRELRLSENRIGVRGAKALAAALGRGHLTALHTLEVGENIFGNEGGAALAVCLGSGALKALRKLNLKGNKIGVQGAVSLAAALASGYLTALENLDIGDNQFGDEGLKALAGVVGRENLPALRGLSLARKRSTGEEWVKVLSATLFHGCSSFLRTLDLSDNGIGNAGAELLAAALIQGCLPSLRMLDLSHNLDIGDKGRKAFQDVESKKPNLDVFWVPTR